MAGKGLSSAGLTVGAVYGNFTVASVPIHVNETGIRGFYVDASGIIRYTADGSAPDENSDPI